MKVDDLHLKKTATVVDALYRTGHGGRTQTLTLAPHLLFGEINKQIEPLLGVLKSCDIIALWREAQDEFQWYAAERLLKFSTNANHVIEAFTLGNCCPTKMSRE